MWSKECNHAFELAKENLVFVSVPVHYKRMPPLTVVVTVITHIMPDGTVRPIAFAIHVSIVLSVTIPRLKKMG